MINLKSILWKVNGGVQRLDDKLEHIQFLTGNTLKVIAVLTMIVGFFSRYSIAENTFPFYFKYQNVFFTLFLGLVALTCLEKFSSISAKQTDKIRGIILQIISVAVIGIIAELFRCDYGLEGILYIAAFYVCRKNRIYQVLLFLLAYMVATGNQPPLCTLLACVLILLL